MPTALTFLARGPISFIGLTTSTLVAKTPPWLDGNGVPKGPTRTTVERSLYSKFGVIETASGVTVDPSLRVTRKSVASTVLGSTGQENSTGSPEPSVTAAP